MDGEALIAAAFRGLVQALIAVPNGKPKAEPVTSPSDIQRIVLQTLASLDVPEAPIQPNGLASPNSAQQIEMEMSQPERVIRQPMQYHPDGEDPDESESPMRGLGYG